MDIVEKLRGPIVHPIKYCMEAAAEIEQLRDEVKSLNQQIAQQNELIHKQMIRIAEIEVKENKVGTKRGMVKPE